MTFPAYQKYKGCEITWINEIPQHWGVLPLLGLASETCKSNIGMLEDNLLSLSYGKIVRKDIGSNDGLLPESFETYQIVEPGDIVFRLTDLQNDKRSLRTAIVKETGIITSAYVATTPNSISSEYLNYLLRAYDATKVFYSMGGGLRQSLKYSDIKRLPILVPSSEEQTSIVSFVDCELAKIDPLITEQERLIELLAEKRQAVISQAMTKGLDKSRPLKDSCVEWIGLTPAHWDVLAIKRLSQVKRGASPRPIDDPKYFDDDGEYAWVRIADVSSSDGFLIETTQKLSELGSSLSVKREPGQLFVSIAGTVGKPCITKIKACIHDGFVYFPSLTIDPMFLYRIFESGICYGGLGKMGTQLNLNTETIGSIKVPLPPPDELAAILDYVDNETKRFDALMHEAQHVIDLLQERRVALISAAVTGKIDVRGFVAPPVQ
jgi:type I restriction enzyme S subunit